MKDIPNDFGAHHRRSSSGVVHALNTMCAGALKVRVTTSSRSDIRPVVVRLASPSRFASIGFLLALQFRDNLVQRVEASGPELAVFLDPGHLILQPALAERAGPDAPDLPGGDKPRLFQNADMLLHAREGHVEL